MIFVRSRKFVKAEKDLLSETESYALEDWLSEYPESGNVIPGSGGCRKVRWAAKGKGKRGGARVIYFYRNRAGIIILMRLYAKNEAENLSHAEVNQLKNEVKTNE